MAFKPLCRVYRRPSNAFARRYTEADLDALAEVEREYGRLSGPATVVVLRRMYQVPSGGWRWVCDGKTLASLPHNPLA